MDVEWFTQRVADSTAGEVAFAPPDGLRLNEIAPNDSIDQMLLDGRLDAYVNVMRPSPELLAEGSGVRRLFADPRAEGIRYLRQTGLYPTNHCVVIKREVVDRHPWVPLSLFNAFKQSSVRAMIPAKALDPYIETGYLEPEMRDVFSKDLFGYGIDSEELVLKTFGEYCNQQGYTGRALLPREVYSHAAWT